MAHSTATSEGVKFGVTGRIISGAVIPLLPIIVGVVLKLGFIDSVPSQDRYQFMIDNYGRPMWIELSVGAYVLAAGVLLTVKPAISASTKRYLLGVPAASFILNILFSLVLPKFGLNSNTCTVWLPTAVGYASLFWVGFLVTGVENVPDKSDPPPNLGAQNAAGSSASPATARAPESRRKQE